MLGPVVPFTVPAPVAVGDVRDAGDRFRCAPYDAVLTARACIERRDALFNPPPFRFGATGGTSQAHHYTSCRRCADGERIEAELLK